MGCGNSSAVSSSKWKAPNPIATFTTSMGVFKAEIYMNRTPRTASSFIDLCEHGFYEGLHFHRVIPGFMNQFGCPYSVDPNSDRAGSGGPEDGSFKNLATGEAEKRFGGGNIKDENIDKTSNKIGTLSCANTGDRDTNGSQFFINVNHNAALDWFTAGNSKHPVFGQITEGLELMVELSQVQTQNDNPVEPVKMLSIAIEFP